MTQEIPCVCESLAINFTGQALIWDVKGQTGQFTRVRDLIIRSVGIWVMSDLSSLFSELNVLNLINFSFVLYFTVLQ